MTSHEAVEVLPSLEKSAQRLNELDSLISQCKEKAVAVCRPGIEFALEAGKLLTEVKATVGHGRFLPWLKANVNFNRMTAARWIRLYENRETIKCNSMLHLTEAYRLLEDTGSRDVIATKFTGDPENYTPSEYIEAARDVLGHIDLDPASNTFAQKTVKAKEFFTEKDDGLSKEWTGTIFLNPPYKSGVIDKFVEKLVSSFESGKAIKAAILLTNDNTDTAWFHRAAKRATAICLLRGRISFYKEDGPRTSPTNGQTFFYFGNETAKFRKRFGEFGIIVRVI